MEENMTPAAERKSGRGRWVAVAFFVLSAVMYVSITIKIIKFGP